MQLNGGELTGGGTLNVNGGGKHRHPKRHRCHQPRRHAGLSKTTTGTVFLTAANSYSGGTTLRAGTLNPSGRAIFGASAGTVTIGAATLQTSGAIVLDNAINLADPAATLDTPNPADDMTLNGVITGTGGLNKTGQGTLDLASAAGNTYSGDTNVLAGTLSADTDGALSPNSNLVIGDGASVVLNFGNVGAGFGLGGFAPPLPAVTPALAEPAPPVPAGISTVPEPSTLLLLLVGALASVVVWRRRSR